MVDAQQMSLGVRLRRERESHHWTQEHLAEKVGGSVPSINRWEHNRAIPRADMLTLLTEVFGKPPERWGSGRAIFWNVPFLRNPYFTGRERILLRLHQALAAEQTVALSQTRAISGLGGIGKTQTAIEYAYRYADEYEAVMWVRSASAESLASDFATLASVLEIPAQQERDQHRLIAAVKRWLQANGPWLLIFDNADDIAMVSEFLPAKGAGATLLTTRSQITGKHIKKIEIERLDPEEGVQFLLHRSGALEDGQNGKISEEKRQHAQALYELMDGLPLALDQAAAYIEEHECSLAEYLSLYQSQRKVLLQRRGSLNEREYPHSVAKTWLLSFQQIEQVNPTAADVLRLCAFLHPDAIPEELLVAGATQLGPELGAIVSNPLLLSDAIGTLRKYSLIRRNAETKMLTIHRLVQAVLQDTLEKEERYLWAERAMLAVNMVFPRAETETWSQCERLLTQTLITAQWIEQYQLRCEEAARLLYKIARYLLDRAHYGEAERLCQQALDIRERS